MLKQLLPILILSGIFSIYGLVQLARYCFWETLEERHIDDPDYPTFYTTPADWRRCENFNPDGPTPCWHPHCDCFKSDKGNDLNNV
jgi:hypothetical protein